MTEEKKTKVLFGFGSHTIRCAKKSVELMKDADVIFIEMEELGFHLLFSGEKSVDEIASLAFFPESLKIILNGAMELKKKGKHIWGNEDSYDRNIWTAEEQKRKLEIEQYLIKKMKRGGNAPTEELSKLLGEYYRIREEKIVNMLEWVIPSLVGARIYVDLGSIHTWAYEELKRRLELKGIRIDAKYINYNGEIKPVSEIIYTPLQKLQRAFRFETPEVKNPETLKKLVEEVRGYEKKANALIKKYEDEGMAKEEAGQRADFELMGG